MNNSILSIKQKALTINLNPTIYGTFAEIGGGQEVARSFFHAGGASGTIAKSISAYDKTFSDILYDNGEKSERYVSEDRLKKMLNKEFCEVYSVLKNQKTENTRFFAFADTISTLNYQKTNRAHGWLGVKYQLNQNSEANEAIIHVNLFENDGISQQNTIGTLGVNLIYACFYHNNNSQNFILSLLDNLDNYRIEIDMISLKGPDNKNIDNRLLSVMLVKNKISKLAVFDKTGTVHQPADFFYKKNLLVLRGSFRPITKVGFDMIKLGFLQFRNEYPEIDRQNTNICCEITLSNLLETGEFNEKDYLERVDLLNAMELPVILSSFKEFYNLSTHLSSFKILNLRMLVGAYIFQKIFDSDYYSNLNGGIVEALSKLFIKNHKLYVFPALNSDNEIVDSSIFCNKDNICNLYNYFKAEDKIIDLQYLKKDRLKINATKVRNLIKDKNPNWELMVLKNIAQVIKKRKMFGYT